MKGGRAALLVSLSLAIWLVSGGCSGESNITPVVYVYAPSDESFAKMLTSLIANDSRIQADLGILQTQDQVIMATALPDTACIVIYSDDGSWTDKVTPALLTYFKKGGGLVGMREICFRYPTSEKLATSVFPTFANASKQDTTMGKKRIRTYLAEEPGVLGDGLPDRFDLVSMGTYYCADKDGNHIRVPGNYRVAYRDGETGSPLVLVKESEGGGRSVAMPGIWVVKTPRVDVYYGNLISDHNFAKLFANSVLWAMGSSRFSERGSNMYELLENLRREEERLAEDLRKVETSRRVRRFLMLGTLWAIGLAVCGVIIKRVLLAPYRENGQ